jgi:hypothetical protein
MLDFLAQFGIVEIVSGLGSGGFFKIHGRHSAPLFHPNEIVSGKQTHL